MQFKPTTLFTSATLTTALLALSLTAASSALAQPGAVLGHAKISDTAGGFMGTLSNQDHFGHAVANLGDVDGDGNPDLAVGVPEDDDGMPGAGAVYVLFLDAAGAVLGEQKISSLSGGFAGVIDANDNFGVSVAGLGDLDGDAIPDLAVGAWRDDDGGIPPKPGLPPPPSSDLGALWILLLNADGTVKAEQKVSEIEGGFGGNLDEADQFGASLGVVGDLDGDGNPELAVGAARNADNGVSGGAIWILFLNADGTVADEQRISQGVGGFGGTLDNFDFFGIGLAPLGDFNGDGVADLAATADSDDDGGINAGAVWLLMLATDGTVVAEHKISATVGNFGGDLENFDNFGSSVAPLGDYDGNGVVDLAVGARGDDDGGSERGAVWMLFLEADGTVESHHKISDTSSDFAGVLDDDDLFGMAVASLGDLDGDGRVDIAVGASCDDDGNEGFTNSDRGAAWVLFLDSIPDVVCGNGRIEADECCDDGNLGSEDGCSDICLCEESPEQQRCIVAMNKSGAKVAKAQGKGVSDCFKRATKGNVADVAACVADQNNGKVEKAVEKTSDTDTDTCEVLPDIGYTGAAATSMAAIDHTVAAMVDLFGSPVDSAVIPDSADKKGAGCQTSVLKAMDKIAQTKLKIFGRCKKDGLRNGSIGSSASLGACLDDVLLDAQDPGGKVAKAISKLVGKVDKSCSTVDTDLAFPGQCVGEPDFALCADRIVECRVCRMLVDMDALELTDCDVFDDAVANGSCGS